MMRRDDLMNQLMHFQTQHVAIDEGGLCIIEVDEDGDPASDRYIEIGGTRNPEEDDHDALTESQERDSIDNQNGDGT